MKYGFINTLFLILFLALALLISSCGGGFGKDSENAPAIEESIFGTDTSRKFLLNPY